MDKIPVTKEQKAEIVRLVAEASELDKAIGRSFDGATYNMTEDQNAKGMWLSDQFTRLFEVTE